MFTGITRGLFTVSSLKKEKGCLCYSVLLDTALVKGLEKGVSIAIDGVCQTVVSIQGLEVGFDAIQETLNKTTLVDLLVGHQVSVERSARFGDEIGGHIVSGHVFETGMIKDRKVVDDNVCLTIQCSPAFFSFIMPKGFISIDGSSLTIGTSNQEKHCFEVYLVPETRRRTNLGSKPVGSRVNLEPDMQVMVAIQVAQRYFSLLEDRLKRLEIQLEQIDKAS